ncbi:hypothetical protein Taro_000046 [Colocasia esculenta]|uniref:DUF4283 domain-containing protein n=1 Tax=Colocasia esculenta TaxID=4460 RepID=A0A843T5U6_COLES|nr:hypothetical protein [Colocasia esculenta]
MRALGHHRPARPRPLSSTMPSSATAVIHAGHMQMKEVEFMKSNNYLWDESSEFSILSRSNIALVRKNEITLTSKNPGHPRVRRSTLLAELSCCSSCQPWFRAPPPTAPPTPSIDHAAAFTAAGPAAEALAALAPTAASSQGQPHGGLSAPPHAVFTPPAAPATPVVGLPWTAPVVAPPCSTALLCPVFFTLEEIHASCKPLDLAIITKTPQGRPPFQEIRSHLQQRFKLLADFIISALDGRHLLIRFLNREDYLQVRLKDSMFIQGCPFRFCKWYVSFSPVEDSPIVPVSLELPVNEEEGMRADGDGLGTYFPNLIVHESFPFLIALSWKGASPDSNGPAENQQISAVFPKGNPIPSVKALSFYRSSTFTIDVVYPDVSELQAPANEGCIGLLRGAEIFDSKQGYKLPTYVYWWIKQAIIKATAKKSWIVILLVTFSFIPHPTGETEDKLYTQEDGND